MPHSTSTLRNWTGYDTTYGILLLSLSTGLWISIPSMGRLFKTKKKKKKRRKEGTRKGILYRCCSHHVLILIMYFLWRWRGVIWCRWCVFSLECPHTSHYLLLRCSLALEKARRHEDCFLLLPLLLSGDGVESIRKKNSNHFVTDCLSCIIRTGWSSHWCVFFCMHWKHSACLCFFNWHVFVFVSFFFFFSSERTKTSEASIEHCEHCEHHYYCYCWLGFESKMKERRQRLHLQSKREKRWCDASRRVCSSISLLRSINNVESTVG